MTHIKRYLVGLAFVIALIAALIGISVVIAAIGTVLPKIAGDIVLGAFAIVLLVEILVVIPYYFGKSLIR